MKRSNMITLCTFLLLAAAVLLVVFLWSSPSAAPGAETAASEAEAAKQAETKENMTAAMDDALFIGDSRTVGLSEYAGIEGADFFASVGMSTYNIHKEPVSVPTVGKVTLTELLSSKKYGKIYIMLGINEVGYDRDKTVEEYETLVDFIREKQPDAAIFLQANLHVTRSRSESDEIVNNEAIDRLNGAIAGLADSRQAIYLDVNPVFDDGQGNLSEDKSEDTAHLYAKYYIRWGQWIKDQTALLVKEG